MAKPRTYRLVVAHLNINDAKRLANIAAAMVPHDPVVVSVFEENAQNLPTNHELNARPFTVVRF
jgi:hypothetical protein